MRKYISITIMSLIFSKNILAQFGNVATDLLGEGSKLMNKGLTKKLQNDPITTSFSDCDIKNVLPATFGDGKLKTKLCDQVFEKNKGYKLSSGFYKDTINSFCLKAGTYGPSKGSGYMYAPLKGPKKDMVYKLITNWKDHEEVTQQQLQLLLWAIIAKTKFKNLSPELKLVAMKLLSSNDMDALSKIGLDFVTDDLIKKAAENLPEPAQKILAVENEMRQKLSAASTSYKEMESLAMLAGIAPSNSEVSDGLWSLLPNGCYIKFLPLGYSKTTIEIYVPDTIKDGFVYFDLAGIVAMPAATNCQRLAQSNIIDCKK